ncbi:MAG: type I glyceraldehyde-3-phosphate dehydrogenase, partial [Pseudomonadota bacterium]
MTIKVAINGYGRIGRNVLRAIYEYNRRDEIQIIAVNDLGDSQTNAHLTRYDTAHGPFNAEVTVDGNDLVVNGDRIRVLAERDPSQLPWGEMGVDIVYECTGIFTTRDKAAMHLEAGAKNVLISAPGKEADLTVVYGVNHDKITADHKVISNASCTTNCLAPIVAALHDSVGIVSGLMNTVHAYTNDQNITDAYHSD